MNTIMTLINLDKLKAAFGAVMFIPAVQKSVAIVRH